MELSKAIESRTSVRSFHQSEVPVEDIREMVRLGGLAPSINNFQPWEFMLIRDRNKLRIMSDLILKRISEVPVRNTQAAINIRNQVEWYSTFFKDAPAVLAVILNPYQSIWEGAVDLTGNEINEMRNFPDLQSTGACIQNILLAAVDMGYGACWLSGPMVAKNDLQEVLGIEKPARLISFIAIGKPSKDFKPREKENLGEKLRII
jgi:nitroreductase